MIKFGIKLWSNNSQKIFNRALDLVSQKVFDFIELYIVPGQIDGGLFRILTEAEVTLHAPHELHGVNFGEKQANNFQILDQVSNLANKLRANVIVVHPGMHGSMNKLRQNLKQITDPRVIIETMPLKPVKILGDNICFGATFEELNAIKKLGFGLCLDFGHTIKSAISQHISCQEFIQQVLPLSPGYFHLSDGHMDNEYDEHLHLGEGQFDLKWIKRQLMSIPQARVVLETPKDRSDLMSDIKNLKHFHSL